MDCQTPCPRYERAMTILGKKWTCTILRCLLAEPRRFTDISGYVDGLSDRLLSQRLQELEEAGVVERRVYAQKPVVVEYSLTDKGEELRDVVGAIQIWADQWEAHPVPA
jgi:DNA-binding HxlR family transcriptional regulator